MRLTFMGIAIFTLSFSGCFHHNECGFSPNLYDQKKVYYDSQGSYREKCPPSNFIEYRDFGLKNRD